VRLKKPNKIMRFSKSHLSCGNLTVSLLLSVYHTLVEVSFLKPEWKQDTWLYYRVFHLHSNTVIYYIKTSHKGNFFQAWILFCWLLWGWEVANIYWTPWFFLCWSISGKFITWALEKFNAQLLPCWNNLTFVSCT